MDKCVYICMLVCLLLVHTVTKSRRFFILQVTQGKKMLVISCQDTNYIIVYEKGICLVVK